VGGQSIDGSSALWQPPSFTRQWGTRLLPLENLLIQHFESTYNSAARIYVLIMKSNITLKLDASLLREIRILAAEEGTSISAMLAARLEQIVRERKSYDRSRRRALARLREGMNLGWTPPRSRDELYER
jgi:hypothetical protein